ncbi:UDP-glucuronic acid decarboxylase family protein [Pleomorphomonas sp. NRK KF1]|uniref:UDP-glucuronic acid decarboxylase family protein n=1 Tax=Pleomorphomonas sp. NRK KF1 TaxID=2943000 RepID=UPI00204465FA|nr:UDP-glucuronic acid decarboxylase family protein [Pleomorphomonas sp. NRK KF1]MCM5553444.1 SDR family oxidoreductase [Pleomorphomonas sp. NRK KF1]
MQASCQKTVLVTGGAGFLGSHLCDRLLRDGHKVISLDNFHTGSRLNHRHQASNPDFELIEADVADPLPDLRIDEIYHLACPASPPHYQESPVTTLRTSLLGAFNVLNLAIRTGARIFLASTSEVYGDPLIHPQREDYWGNVNSFGERACYDEGKRAAEALFHAHASEKGVDIRIARIFNTYGPRMQPDDGRVVSNFVVEALQGQPITIYGDGSQTRSFCYVDDLVEGFVRLMASDVRTPVNLGNPGEFSVTALAAMVVAMTGSQSSISHLPLPSDDPRRRRPDISKAELLLDWRPTVSLEAGLGPTISYFRKIVSNQSSGGRSALQPVV